MDKRKNQNKPIDHDRNNQLVESRCPKGVTRREFVQYSTFALAGAALSLSLIGCGGGGGDEAGGVKVGENEPIALKLDSTNLEPGQVLGIQSSDSPDSYEIPEDIFTVAVQVDETVTYSLRPTYFREGWIGVMIPPMVQADGSYFDSKEVEVILIVRGTQIGQSMVAMKQDLSLANDGESLLILIDDVLTELKSIEDEKETLFEDAALLKTWNTMYTVVRDALDWLSATISSVIKGDVSTVTSVGGDSYNVVPQDFGIAELMITELAKYDTGNMANEFLDSIPEPGRTLIKQLTVLLNYVIPAAFVVMTMGPEDSADIASGTAAVAAILTAAIPAACMCVAGNCQRIIAESEKSEEWIKGCLNWYANVLMGQGLYALNDQMVCDYTVDKDLPLKLVTQDSMELIENISDSLYGDVPWSNSTPWSNGVPWSNNVPWSNMQWTNQPWSHTPWNNTNPWSNNIWNHTAPWSNNTWNHVAPWSNTPWSNTPWSNTPWSNTPWSNTPWSNWNNNWNNFVNSGIQNT